MNDKCIECDSEEDLQTHHISYNPEMTITLCKECHEKLHGHNTGPPRGISSKTGQKRMYVKIDSDLWEEIEEILKVRGSYGPNTLAQDLLYSWLGEKRLESEDLGDGMNIKRKQRIFNTLWEKCCKVDENTMKMIKRDAKALGLNEKEIKNFGKLMSKLFFPGVYDIKESRRTLFGRAPSTLTRDLGILFERSKRGL